MDRAGIKIAMCRIFCAITLLFIFGGCGFMLESAGIGSVKAIDAQAIIKHTSLEIDKHRGYYVLRGPRCRLWAGDCFTRAYNATGNYYFLRAYVPIDRGFSDESTLIQLYISNRFQDWVFLESAWSEGYRLSMREIDSSVEECYDDGCWVREEIALDFTATELDQIALTQETFDFRLQGQRGYEEYSIPTAYLAAFLEALRERNYIQ